MATATMERATTTANEIDKDRIARGECAHEWTQ